MNSLQVKQSIFCFLASSLFVGFIMILENIREPDPEIVTAHVSELSYRKNNLYYGDTIVSIDKHVHPLQILAEKEEVELRHKDGYYLLYRYDN